MTLTTTHGYDAKGRETATTHPDGSTTTVEYNAIDKPVKSCDALMQASPLVEE